MEFYLLICVLCAMEPTKNGDNKNMKENIQIMTFTSMWTNLKNRFKRGNRQDQQ